MLAKSPPERDVEWTERGVQGAWRFTQRLWRLVGEAAEIAKDAPAERPAPVREAAATPRQASRRAVRRSRDDTAQGCARRACQGFGRDREAALQCVRCPPLRVCQRALRLDR